MHKFTIKTSLPTPFFKYDVSVRYNEVAKPTGVAYLLLVLLANAPKSENISGLLESFGIPHNLHSIFANEIKMLIRKKIITCNNYNPIRFDSYNLQQFSFTPLGQKVFREEMITTENTKTAKSKFYYDIATNQLSLKADSDLEVRKVENAEGFDDNFFAQFECKKNVEDFLNQHKTDIGIKPREVISELSDLRKENWFGKYPCKFVCNGDEFKVLFDHKYVQEFFNTYYTNEILNKSIKAKKKFDLTNLRLGKLSYFDEFEIEKVMFAPEFKGEVQNQFGLILTKGNYQTNKNSLTITDQDAINRILDYIEVIAFAKDRVSGYCPVELVFAEERLGKVTLPVVLVLKIEKSKLQDAINHYLDTRKEYSVDTFRNIVSISKIMGNYDKAIEIMGSYMTEHPDTNISRLNEIKSLATGDNALLENYKNIVKQNYLGYLNGVREDSLETFLKITKGIPDFIGIEPGQVLGNITKTIPEPTDKINMFENLVQSFDAQLVLQFINPVKEILNNGKPNSKLAIDLQNFDNLIKELKEISGIRDYRKYTYSEEILLESKFQEVFLNLKEKDKKIELFKLCDKEYFEECAKFIQIFSTINDSLNIIKNAQKNPQDISKDLIDKKIASGGYQYVLVNLSIKLESILSKKFGCEGSLIDMLKQAKNEDKIDEPTFQELDDMRDNRNAVVHPENRKTSFVPDDLRKWTKIVFDLDKQKKDEPKQESGSNDNKPRKKRRKK